MDMKKIREYMAWYSEFFAKYVAPALERAGFAKQEAGFWGFNSFRRPFITVLEAVGTKAYNDTLVFFGILLVPTAFVMVGTLSTCRGLPVFTGAVEIAVAYLVFALSMYLFRNSFEKERPFWEVGASVYSGESGAKKFLKRYSADLVILAIHEAGKVAKRFKRRRNCDDYLGFYSKLFNFNGFEENEDTQEQDQAR